MSKPYFRLLVLSSLITLTACQPKDKAESSAPAQVTLSQERPLTIQGNASGVSSYAPTVKATAPAVVNIFTTEIVKHNAHPLMNDPMFRRFFEFHGMNQDESEPRSGLGSGVIVSKDGYILTIEGRDAHAAVAQENIDQAKLKQTIDLRVGRAADILKSLPADTAPFDFIFIDADISFNPNDIPTMVRADKDIICGLYPKKEINWHTVYNAVKKDAKIENLKNHTGSWVVNLVDYRPEITVRNDKPLEVFAGGTGMMLIKRKVFDKLKKKVPSYENDVVDQAGSIGIKEVIHEYFATSIEPETNRLLSEDYHFCRLWRMNGGKIYIAPWMDLGHMGSYLFEGTFLKVD